MLSTKQNGKFATKMYKPCIKSNGIIPLNLCNSDGNNYTPSIKHICPLNHSLVI